MKRTLSICLLVFAALTSTGQPAQWLKKVDHFGTEYVGAMAYVPGSAGVGASLWTYTLGELPSQPGGSSASAFENRLISFKESDGNLQFNKLVKWAGVLGMAYDSSSDELIMVVSNVSNNPLGRVSIGTDTFKIIPDQVPPALPCSKIAVVRYSRNGTLNGYALLDYPCQDDDKLDYSFGVLCAINTVQNKVALSYKAFGKLTPPINTVTFAGQSRQVSRDSSYITVFQWDYQGTQLRMNMFDQPRTAALRSTAQQMVYDNTGNIYLSGDLNSDINFGTVTVPRGSDILPSFVARLRPDGTVAAARRVQSGPKGGFMNAIAFNDYNGRLYIAGNWRNQLWFDGNLIATNMDSNYAASMFVAALDSTLALKSVTTLRDGDTVNANQGVVQLVDLEIDSRGHILATGSFKGNFLVDNTLFHPRSFTNPQFANTDVLVVDFTPVLQLDTLYMSEGAGGEGVSRVVAGKPAEMYVGGSFNGSCSFPPYNTVSTPSPPSWATDAYYARLKWGVNPTAIAGMKPISSVLYPNPAYSEVRIELPDMQQIKVTTLDGRLVKQLSLATGTSNYSLSVASWPAGLYLVQVRDRAGSVHSSKLLKQ